MSPSRSDTGTDVTADPLRPGDHADTDVDTSTEISQPALGVMGWLRWAWRQLTSMRTALVLLLFQRRFQPDQTRLMSIPTCIKHWVMSAISTARKTQAKHCH